MMTFRTKHFSGMVDSAYQFTTTASIGGVMNGEVRSLQYLYADEANYSVVGLYASTNDEVSAVSSFSSQAAGGEYPWLGQIVNSFYSDEKLALEFVRMIKHMKPTQITALVNEWIGQKKISGQSCNRDLWKPLHEHGLYLPSEQNWNKQVRRP